MGSFIIAFTCLLQLVWATAIILNPAAADVTALYTVSRIFNDSFPELLIIIAILASIPTFLDLPKIAIAVCLLPQQIFLTFISERVAYWVYKGEFPDGVIRTSTFLLADQGWIVLLGAFHLLAVWKFLFKRNNWTYP